MKGSHHPDDRSGDFEGRVIRGQFDDGIGGVGGDEADAAGGTFEVFDGSFPLDVGEDDGAGVPDRAAADDHEVAVEDPGLDHAVALDLEGEQIFLAEEGVKVEVVPDVFFGEDGESGGGIANEGDAGGIEVVGLGGEAEASGEAGDAFEESLSDEGGHMIGGGPGGAKAEVGGNFPDGGWGTGPGDRIPDEVEDGFLFFSKGHDWAHLRFCTACPEYGVAELRPPGGGWVLTGANTASPLAQNSRCARLTLRS